jgi:molecular chaperone GrpE
MRIPVYSGDPPPPEPAEGKPAAPEPLKAAEPKPAAPKPAEPEEYLFSLEPASAAAPADDYRDLYLRTAADMANFRRRTEERARLEVEEERRRLLNELLAVSDNLEQALAHQDDPGLRQGLRQTWAGLQSFLGREGVEALAAEGRPFDPQEHEAVATVERPGAEGTVLQEVQRGYRYHGRLLRPARVVVGREWR